MAGAEREVGNWMSKEMTRSPRRSGVLGWGRPGRWRGGSEEKGREEEEEGTEAVEALGGGGLDDVLELEGDGGLVEGGDGDGGAGEGVAEGELADVLDVRALPLKVGMGLVLDDEDDVGGDGVVRLVALLGERDLRPALPARLDLDAQHLSNQPPSLLILVVMWEAEGPPCPRPWCSARPRPGPSA